MTKPSHTMNRMINRREMLQRCSTGFGMLALAGLMPQNLFGALRQPEPDFKPRAKNVIFCYMSGGVSHIDSFDPKPMLKKHEASAGIPNTSRDPDQQRQDCREPV